MGYHAAVAAHPASAPASGAIQLLSWVTPYWLSGLALLPLIRWLHRGGSHRRALPVSRLRLWRGSAASVSATGMSQPPDPAWRRRTLLAALLFVVLAEPQWPEQHPRITLWVDDSISMLTREPPQAAAATTASNGDSTSAQPATDTRLLAGLAQARMQLDQVAHGEVAVRSLSDPWRDLGPLTEAAITTLAAGAGQSEPSAPPAALVRTNSLHWLVTDGADAEPISWPGNRRPDRIIEVATVTRNVGLERLSARRNPLNAQRIDLLVKLTNGGTAIETRELVVAAEAREISRTRHSLDPGTSAFASVSIPASSAVRATLQPGDALAKDDSLTLELAPLRKRRVATDPNCPVALVTAVDTHPALALAPQGASDAEAQLDCGLRRADNGVPTIHVIAEHTPMQAAGPVKWSTTVPVSRRTRLEIGNMQVAARMQARPGDTVLLAAGDESVIIARTGASKRIETSLDFGSMAATAGPDIPLLVNLMFESLFDESLLDELAITDRGPAAARVAPLAGIEPQLGTLEATGAPILHDWTHPLLLATLLVLLWEIVALARQAYRSSKYAQAGSA
jgi:hypothetical protein